MRDQVSEDSEALPETCLVDSLRAAGDVAYRWDLASDRLSWSGNAAGFFADIEKGVPQSGQALAGMVAPDDPSHWAVVKSAHSTDAAGEPYALQYRLKLSPGLEMWVEDCGRRFPMIDGSSAYAAGIIRRIDARHHAEMELRRLSERDALTGTLTQSRLISLITDEMTACRASKTSFAFLLVSVDNLATINSGLGFDIGDEALVAVTARLRRHMRARDDIGRFTGNKFGIILRHSNAADMAVAAQRFIDVTRAELVGTSAGPVAVSLSVGGVLGRRAIASHREMMAEAHEALSDAKARKRGLFVPFDPQTSRAAERRQDGRIGETMVRALNERRVVLACQPIVRAGSRVLASHEALVRIEDDKGETLPPGLVVPAAERLGLCGLLDHRVLELGLDLLCQQRDIRLSINISAQTTSDSSWLTALAARLVSREDMAQRLTVELTESAAIQDIEESARFLEQIKSLGCHVAIDDFGAGHTSFRYLRDMKVDSVKIDGSYISGLSTSRDNQIFVRTMIGLARDLDIRTVAEWVDSEVDASLLESWGIDYMQGRLFGDAEALGPAVAEVSLRRA